jgi:hypothetical protein
MKIWNSYGSEHSSNLVMIGNFESATDAEEAKQVIDSIEKYIKVSGENHHLADKYSDGMLELLKDLKFYTVQPWELEQFEYDIRSKVDRNRVIITTDETDVSSFLKILIDKGARVEVYSAHNYPGTGEGR